MCPVLISLDIWQEAELQKLLQQVCWLVFETAVVCEEESKDSSSLCCTLQAEEDPTLFEKDKKPPEHVVKLLR